MTVEERPSGDVVVLDLHGAMTLGEGQRLVTDAIKRVVQQGCRKVVLNLEDVMYMDSAGLGAIVQGYTTLAQRNGSLGLVNLTARIRHLLAITKLLAVFDVYESEPEALAALR